MKRFIFILGAVFPTFSSMATNVHNDYVFIQNDVDSEYFITPRMTDPRFSGSNKFTKYANSQQLSLGYMGYTGFLNLNAYADIWIENSPIHQPFIGNRCMKIDPSCPSTGYLPAGYLNHNGIYHTKISTLGGEAAYPRGIFSSSAYEYFKNVPVGTTETYTYKFCSTMNDYDPSKGETCKSVGGNTGSHVFTITKTGHIKLESTDSVQEIFIDTNGNPSIGPGSKFCSVGYVNSVSGAICKMVSYSMRGSVFDTMNINMNVDASQVGFIPGANSILIGPDGSSGWVNYSSKITKASDIFKSGKGGIYVFFSKTFLKQLVDRSIDLTHSQNFFTFEFNNAVVPQSGFYEFTPSNNINIHPRDYGISIISKDHRAHPSAEGKLGSSEPIKFDYIVTTSGPRQANSVKAQVTGESKSINGQAYCIFSSDDNNVKVPFPAYLSWTTKNGSINRERAGCGGDLVDITGAHWEETPWPEPDQDDGKFYRTDLELIFPLTDSASFKTLDGKDWIGAVSASGEVKVTAEWSGPDIH